jgi:hypothetical protein
MGVFEGISQTIWELEAFMSTVLLIRIDVVACLFVGDLREMDFDMLIALPNNISLRQASLLLSIFSASLIFDER